MENYKFSHSFVMGGLLITPVHVRVEQHPTVIAAHRHSHASYELHYTQRGQGTVTVNGVTHAVGPGTLYMTGRGIEHAQRCDPADPIIEYCLYLNCRHTGRGGPGPLELFEQTAFWMGEDHGRVYPLLQQLIDENRSPQPETAELLEALLRQIIVRLTRIYRQHVAPVPEARTVSTLTQAELVFIIEDAFLYRYRTLALGDLAALLSLSVRQTQRLLRDNFGKTFSQKLTEARMAAACQFLSTTGLSISEISDRVGFSSIEHFSAAFSRFMGCPPSRYRKELN